MDLRVSFTLQPPSQYIYIYIYIYLVGELVSHTADLDAYNSEKKFQPHIIARTWKIIY
jgi:hypothetical protein